MFFCPINFQSSLLVPFSLPNNQLADIEFAKACSYDCVSNKVAPILFTNRRRTDYQTSKKIA